MRYIKITETPTITFHIQNAREGSPATLLVDALWFIQYLNDTDHRLNNDAAGIKSSIRIDNAVKKAKAEKASFVLIDDADWDKLRESAEKPSAGYPGTPARRFQPFIDMISEAAVEAPKEDSATAPS